MSKIAFIHRQSGSPAQTTGAPRGTRGFFMWLKNRQPLKYRAIMDNLGERTLQGLGIADPNAIDTATDKPIASGWADKIKDIVSGVSQAYLGYEQVQAQKKLFNANLKRAQQGLTMLDSNSANFGMTGPNVNVGLTSDVKSLLVYGGIAALGVWVLMGVAKRR